VFDWLIGQEGADWGYDRRWQRDIVGMSLRQGARTHATAPKRRFEQNTFVET
jgi:hypothetical protein